MPGRNRNSCLPVAAALLALLARADAAPAQRGKPSPHFTGEALPEPPAQRRPWQAPASELPKPLLTAAEALFKVRLADPRGCEYRAVQVAVGSCWSGDGGIIKTHAWALPAKAGARQRFAVCWNGLVYPVLSVGERADLKADVLAVVKADEEARAAYEKRHGPNSYYRFRHAWAEGYSVAHDRLLPLRACLLLRLGEEGLARRVWAAWTAGMRPNTNDDGLHLRDPFLMLATDWTWALFDRGLCAHQRGDDRLAVLGLRALVPVRKAVTAEALRRGFQKGKGPRDARIPLLGFLDPATPLLADQERRARERPLAPGAPDPKEKDRAKRITALVRDLQNVSARQMGQPGGVALNMDGRVNALIKEGEAAVGPLLDCLERDNRLTRSVQFHRDFFHHRRVLGVAEAAHAALCGIMKTHEFGPGTERWTLLENAEGRKKVAAAIRAYCQKFLGVSPEERWYRILKDEASSPQQWLEAAGEVARAGEGEVPGGKALRAKASPSVTALLARRVAALSTRGALGTERNLALRDGCVMATYLARWDRQAALPVLREQIKRCRETLADGSGQLYLDLLASQVAGLFLLRANLGDAKAVEEYAGWVSTLTPAQVEGYERAVFRPLWRHPEHPAVVKAAAALFENPRSPWPQLLRTHISHRISDLVRSPLLGLRSFRVPLFAALADKTPVGTAQPHEGGSLSIRVDGGWHHGTSYTPADPLVPRPETEVRFRRCDLVANSLSAVHGLPRLQLYWPEAERDRALGECVRLLRQYGDRFRYNPAVPQLNYALADSGVFLTFPPLGRPATQKDVLRGAAIFSLEGEGKIRAAGLPAWPLKARWTTLKKYPYGYSWARANGEHGTGVGYHQDGLVWQAEEVFKEGKWRRYYGFVGAGPPARVPAGEVEFPPPWGWSELPGGLDCLLETAAPAPGGHYVAGKPLTVRLKLRNRSGVDRTVPSLWLRKGGEGVELRAGLSVEVFYLPPGKGPTLVNEPYSEPGEEWGRLKPRKTGHFQDKAGTRTLRPAGEWTALELDLAERFDLSRPGAYAVRLVFARGAGLPAAGRSNLVAFSLGER
jgi:hypothetical protein